MGARIGPHDTSSGYFYGSDDIVVGSVIFEPPFKARLTDMRASFQRRRLLSKPQLKEL